MRRNGFLVLAIVCVGLIASTAQATDFYLHNTLDLSNSNYFPTPLFDNNSPYGTNPSAVTTDGSSLWIAGFNGGTSVGVVSGIVRIDAPWTTPAATSITSIATPGSRGFSGVDYDPVNGLVLAAFDDGAADPNGLTAWDATTNGLAWAKSIRGGSGTAYDYGFGGVDNGAAWTTFGSGRRALQDSATGADIYTTANGLIINAGSGTFWRSMDIAPDGDIWARRSNGVIFTDRTGGNSGASPVAHVAPVGSADFVNGHNIAYLDGLAGGDLVIYNDRPSAALGQVWATATKVLNADGTVATTQFYDAFGAALDPGFGLGSGYFDYAWDATGESLIALDFNNRLVYQFKTFAIPEPTTLALLGLGAAVMIRRRR